MASFSLAVSRFPWLWYSPTRKSQRSIYRRQQKIVPTFAIIVIMLLKRFHYLIKDGNGPGPGTHEELSGSSNEAKVNNRSTVQYEGPSPTSSITHNQRRLILQSNDYRLKPGPPNGILTPSHDLLVPAGHAAAFTNTVLFHPAISSVSIPPV